MAAARARRIAEAELGTASMRSRGLAAVIAAFVAAVREWHAPTGRIHRGSWDSQKAAGGIGEDSTE